MVIKTMISEKEAHTLSSSKAQHHCHVTTGVAGAKPLS